jgi:hypothetical protein
MVIRNFKALGLALVAVFAMSAVVASAAQATPGTLTAEGRTVTVTGEQVGEHVFTLTDHQTPPGSGVFANTKCKKTHFDGIGSVTDGATSITVTPTYIECTAFGQPATIEHTSCKYVLKTETPTPAGTGWHVNTAIVCNPGDEIHVQTGTCSVTVPAQEDLTTSEATNSGTSGTGMDLLMHTNIRNTTYTVTKDNIGCPLSGTGTFHKGDIDGTTTIRAHTTVGGGLTGITLH